MTSVDDTAVYFDPYDVDINADPYPTYARVLAEAPAYFNERYGFWALSRHDDVKKALVNWRVFSRPWRHLGIITADVDLPSGVVLFEDPPVHAMRRGLMSMFSEYIEWRAQHPSDDLMTQLLNPEFEDELGERRKLTRQDVLTYTSVIAGAGNETTGGDWLAGSPRFSQTIRTTFGPSWRTGR